MLRCINFLLEQAWLGFNFGCNLMHELTPIRSLEPHPWHVLEEINQYWSNLSKLINILYKLGEGGNLEVRKYNLWKLSKMFFVCTAYFWALLKIYEIVDLLHFWNGSHAVTLQRGFHFHRFNHSINVTSFSNILYCINCE